MWGEGVLVESVWGVLAESVRVAHVFTLAVGYDDAGTVVCRADLKILSTFKAHSKSGKRLGYLVGSASASAAFSLMTFKSFFQSSKTVDIILDGEEGTRVC